MKRYTILFSNIHKGIRTTAAVMTALMCWTQATAAPISLADAERIASAYVNIPTPTAKSRAADNDTYQPYYIFNDKTAGNGFVIIAGKDDINPVLGYSKSGHITYENMPDGLRAWLSQAEEFSGGKNTRSGEATTIVAPLIKSKWYQLTPYNGKLANDKILTGCVATAMSQIINFHKWPNQPNGNGTYESFHRIYSGSSETVGQISYDLSESHYDFDRMLDVYADGKWTPEQADAVATLMRDCGYAARMQYTTSVSGSYDEDMAIGMTEHFGYDAEIYPHFGNYSDTDLWLEKIKKELDGGFPVIMTGQASMFGGEGHCFIADGYDSNDFLHINWGWNGDADGFYNVGVLSPIHHGSLMNFSYMQYFTTLHPRKDGKATPHNPHLVMLWDPKNQSIDNSGLTVENEGETLTSANPAKVKVDGLCYIAYRSYKGEFILRLMDSNGKMVKDVVSVPIDHHELSADSEDQRVGISEVTIPGDAFNGVADGEYRLVPMGKYQDMEARVAESYGYKSSLIVKVSDGKASVHNIQRPETDLTYVKPLAIESELPLFSKIDTSIEIANKGEFIEGGRLIVELTDEEETKNAVLHESNISLYAGRTTSIPLSLPILKTYKPNYDLDVEPGKTYKIKYRGENSNKENLDIKGDHADQEFRVVFDSSMVPRIIVDAVRVTDSKGNACDISNLILKNDEDYSVDYDYHTEGIGAMPFKAYIEYGLPPWGIRYGDNALASTLTIELPLSFLMLDPYETNLVFRYRDFLTGEMTDASPTSLSKIPVKVVDPSSGIDEITPEGKPFETARYNTLGKKLSRPTPGINIVVFSNGSVRKEYVETE